VWFDPHNHGVKERLLCDLPMAQNFMGTPKIKLLSNFQWIGKKMVILNFFFMEMGRLASSERER
jgi:hypothetical protein